MTTAEAGAASKTLSQILPHVATLGITRVADITGLDRIGIPVVQAVRPLSLVNAVTQGKGADLATAAVSAIMEAGEQHFAERVEQIPSTIGTAQEMGVQTEQFQAHLSPDAPASWPLVPTRWVVAQDLLFPRTAWVPLELVHCAYAERADDMDGLFAGSTTGLACALTRGRVLLHGLLECIERDAVARAQSMHGFFQRQRIDEATCDDREFSDLVQRCGDAGCLVAFWLAAARGGVPVIWCQIMEDGRLPPILPFPAEGFAADPDPLHAASRALLEAVQARLAAISGARDDLTRSRYPSRIDWDMVARHRRFLSEGPRSISLGQLRDSSIWHGEDALEGTLDRLRAAGIVSILSVPLPTASSPIFVAHRVLVPQLLPLNEG